MLPTIDLALFALAALVMVLTPGPNMVYLVSRSLCQGRKAGVISLFGVAAGFLVHMFAAAAGLTAVFMAIPLAYRDAEVVRRRVPAVARVAGAQAWRRWIAVRAAQSGGRLAAQAVCHGVFINALNPKIAVFYLSVFPQFVRPDYGSVFAQSLQLGLVQIMVSFCVNLALILSAARLAAWFAKNPLWLAVQRLTMGFVLTGLAVRLALEERRN